MDKNMISARVFSNSMRKNACRTHIFDTPGKVRHYCNLLNKWCRILNHFFQIDRIWVTVSHSNLVPYDPICGRPFWFAYLADIFAEVHLTFSMNYFPLVAKVNHLFVSPFHHDIVGTEFETLAHAIYATISWTYAIYLFIKGLKWFE